VTTRPRFPGLLPALAVGAVLAAAACAEHEFDPPDREARIARADSLYEPARFDTVTWASDSLRAIAGNVVYSASCRNCHGQLGEGGTPYAAQRGLEVPSLVAAGWRWADEPDSVRHRIYVGHIEGMPTWGVAGLTDREIDAVTHYLLEVLRPELLGRR
jgi:mono/diheme cytochrome c family protein